jgi:hypothetical protein
MATYGQVHGRQPIDREQLSDGTDVKPLSKRIDINFAPNDGASSIAVDGIDISNWISAGKISIHASIDGIPQVTVTLAAPELNITYEGRS